MGARMLMAISTIGYSLLGVALLVPRRVPVTVMFAQNGQLHHPGLVRRTAVWILWFRLHRGRVMITSETVAALVLLAHTNHSYGMMRRSGFLERLTILRNER
jgi:hypothetical protein